jgi:hypothetical protein
VPAILVEWGGSAVREAAGLVVGAAGRCGREGGCGRGAARNDVLKYCARQIRRIEGTGAGQN